jgi:prolipoprotein diacylglyceryl transferase
LEIHVYGILMGIAVATAYIVTVTRYERFGGDRALAERAALWAVIIGFAGARLAYVSTHLDRFSGDWLGILRLWEGGIALFGGLTFGTAAAIVVLRRGGGDVPRFADAISVALPASQAIGRWGNYFNQELFGTPTDLPWGLEIDPVHRPAEYADSATFHPTFLYESLWNVGIIVFLLVLERRVALRRGTLFFLYGILYGVIRFLTELIRTDTTFRFLGLSRNAWFSLGVVVVMGILLRIRGLRPRADGDAEHAGQPEERSGELEPTETGDEGRAGDATR